MKTLTTFIKEEYSSKEKWTNKNEAKDLISDIYDVIACNTQYTNAEELYDKLEEEFEMEVDTSSLTISFYRKDDENKGYILQLKQI